VEDIVVPTTREIFNMSSMRCQQERIRMKNEISFARGDETTGGPSNANRIAAIKAALGQIEDRLQNLTNREAA
jgi:hypothetical protein